MLQKIPKHISQYIKSQQYIVDTYTIVKELLENSLDSSASIIKVIVLDNGVTVEDNGEGISDLNVVCKAGFTSKEDTTYKVLGLNTYDTPFSHGFRGQALSSICELCDVEITSRCPTSTLANCKNYVNEVENIKPREVGTTVKVTNLFKNCPIRKKINEKSVRKSLSKIISLMKGFTYVYDAHITLVYKNTPIFSEKGSSNTKEFTIEKHGNVNLQVDDDLFSFYLFPFDNTKTEVFLFEKRVCKYARAETLIKSVFKQYFDYDPTFVLVLRDECDVNISADKSEVILKNCKYVENKIKSEMDRYFSMKTFIHGNANSDDQCKSTEEVHLTRDNYNSLEVPDVLSIETTPVVDPNTQKCKLLSAHNVNAFEMPTPGLDEIVESSFKHDNSCCKKECGIRRMSVYTDITEESLTHSDIIFEKADFKKIKIIGQFNQGFILGTLEKNDKIVILVVDQHAAAEIYNFELLKKTFKLKRQQLLQPIELNVSAMQQLVIEDNLSVFLENGFEVVSNKLYSLPVYSGVFFTVCDFYSLLENITNNILISDRFRDIMASKACRSSVMVGTCLGVREMQTILDNLATLTAPWCCPHGRPTFKILSELSC